MIMMIIILLTEECGGLAVSTKFWYVSVATDNVNLSDDHDDDDHHIYSVLQALIVYIGPQIAVLQCTTTTTLLLLVAEDQFFWRIISWWRSLRM